MENLKKLELTGFQIKVLGIILMVFDHIFEMFNYLDVPIFFRWLGRPVAILFIYMSVEGFIHTSNRYKYASRLLFGFWFMGIFNFIILKNFFFTPDVILMNNIFGTLFLGIYVLICIEMLIDGIKNKHFKNISLSILGILIPAIISVISIVGASRGYIFLIYLPLNIFPGYFLVEGGILFVILPVVLYYLRENKHLQMLTIAIFALISTGFNFSVDMLRMNFQWMCVFAIIPLYLYNGKKGKSMKNFFYIFYPAHIYILYFASYIYFTYFY